MGAPRLLFNNTVLRDGHQSLAATRMSTAQMAPLADELDRVGFHALETWGGATIDASLRFLNENPFERLGALRRLTPRTPHMMLLRGQNIVQYAGFPDDVVEAFVAAAAGRGMDIFRIFDALNDTRNLGTAIGAARRAGKHAQGCLCYTVSPAHTLDGFVRLGEELQEMGCDSVCIKDMAGLISASAAYELVSALKRRLRVPVILHSHSTAGMAAGAYYAASEAGVDEVDTSIAPFANGTGQPDTALMIAMLERSPRRPDYDLGLLARLRDRLEHVYRELEAYTSPKNERTDPDILRYQVPGGMVSNFRTQLAEQGMAGRIDDVMDEIPNVRRALGWVPLVTPTSQIVGTQAMLNVKFGPWKMISEPVLDVALGKYGRPPAPIEPDLLREVERRTGQNAIGVRPADLLEPRMETIRRTLRVRGLPDTDEVAVLHAMFPQETENLLKGAAARPAPRAEMPPPEPPDLAEPPAPEGAEGAHAPTAGGGAQRMTLVVDGGRHEVTVEEI